MKTYTIIFLSLLLSINLLFAQDNSNSSLSLTIYNQNFGVVKDTRTFNLKKGVSKLAITDVAQYIIPSSVIIDFKGEVLEQNYQYDLVNIASILNRYIDKPIQIFTDKNELIEGTLLSSQSDQLVLRKKDGGLLMIPAFNNYRISAQELPNGLITRPTLLWLLKSDNEGSQNINFTYQTLGLSWHAEYVAVLNNNDDSLDIKAWVNITNNSGTEYKDAGLKLIAGNVRFTPPYLDNMQIRGGRSNEISYLKDGSYIIQENPFFEYHMYSLNNPVTLSNNENKQISLFEASGVKIQKKYFYSNKFNSDKKVDVVVEFENKKQNNLGIPFPQGKFRVYKTGSSSTEYIGEDNINHIPKDGNIKLRIGSAFDIVAEEKTLKSEALDEKEYENTYEIKLKNSKDEDIEIIVEKLTWKDWEIIESSINYIKEDANTYTFKVPVKRNSETILRYVIREKSK